MAMDGREEQNLSVNASGRRVGKYITQTWATSDITGAMVYVGVGTTISDGCFRT